MEKKIDVLIKGQGIVGMTLALHLSKFHLQIGLTLGHQPQKANTKQDARYFALNNASKKILEDVLCWPGGHDVTPLRAMQIFGDGLSELTFSSPIGHSPLAWIVKAASLHTQLRHQIGLTSNITWLEDHEKSQAPLLLICEGKHSAMRQQLGVSFETQHYQQHAFATLIDTGVAHHGQAIQWFIHGESGAEILGLLPCEGIQSSVMSMIWSLPSQKAFEFQMMSEAQMAQEIARITGSRFPQLKIIGPSALWPLAASKAQQWVGKLDSKQSWALLGDSAHTVHPLAGMGLNLGLGDVGEMTRLFKHRAEKEFWRKTNDLYLLRQYERARKTDILSSWYFCDAIQQLFSNPNEMIKSFRNLGLNSVQQLQFVKSFFMQQAGSSIKGTNA